jgi:hypothetical protein
MDITERRREDIDWIYLAWEKVALKAEIGKYIQDN